VMGAVERNRGCENTPRRTPSGAGPSERAVFDLEAALARVEGDLSLLQELIKIFLEDMPRQLAEIQQAIATKDARRLNRAAHNLGGAIGNFEAGPAHEAAMRLEKISAAVDIAGAADAAAELERTLQRLRRELLAVSAGN
jgi:two-component system, sensor histidine kinase and response regulator